MLSISEFSRYKDPATTLSVSTSTNRVGDNSLNVGLAIVWDTPSLTCKFSSKSGK